MTDADRSYLDARPRRTLFLRAAWPDEDCALVLVSRINAGMRWRRIQNPTGTAGDYLDRPERASEEACAQIASELEPPKYRGRRWEP
jgi:hypothetical protein